MSRLEHPSPLHCRPDGLTAALRRRGTGAAQPAVAGVAEAANSVINVHRAVMQLDLDLIDYVLKWAMRRCKLIEINKQCIRPEWLMAPRPGSTLLGRGKDGGEAIGGQRLVPPHTPNCPIPQLRSASFRHSPRTA